MLSASGHCRIHHDHLCCAGNHVCWCVETLPNLVSSVSVCIVYSPVSFFGLCELEYWIGCNPSKIPNNTMNPNLFDQLYNLSHILLTENDSLDRSSTSKQKSITDTSFYPSCVSASLCFDSRPSSSIWMITPISQCLKICWISWVIWLTCLWVSLFPRCLFWSAGASIIFGLRCLSQKMRNIHFIIT